MCIRQINEMFENDRNWLSRQPRMNPWESGCENLAAWLVGWLVIYSKRVCDRVVTAGDDRDSMHSERMWLCLSYHWQQAAELAPDGKIDGTEVADSVREGQGYKDGGQLGGDPLRDVVLAVAMQNEDNRATTCFQKEYRDFSRAIAGKLSSQLYRQVDEWWDELVDHLAGYTKSASLAHYAGKSALRTWLPKVIWNFLRRQRLGAGGEGEIPEHWVGETELVITDERLDECCQAFVPMVANALGALEKWERLILRLYYVDGWTQQEIARLFNMTSGHMGRLRKTATKKLHENLREAAAELDQTGSYKEHLDYLQSHFMEVPKDFSDALHDALELWRRVEDEEDMEDQQ